MRRFSLLAIPLVLALFSGCASGIGATQPSASKPSKISDPAQVHRPIDAFYPTTADLIELTSSHQDQVNACLKSAGIDEHFAYADKSSMTNFFDKVANDRVTRSSLWGFFDPSQASHYGYQPAPGSVTSISLPPQSKEAQAKCPMASSTVPDPATWVFDWALPRRGPETPTNDPRVVSATAAWSSCMDRRGFSYSSPLEAMGKFQNPGRPSQQQIQTAKADVACKIKTNLVGRALAIQVAYDKVYITSNRSALDHFTAEFKSNG